MLPGGQSTPPSKSSRNDSKNGRVEGKCGFLFWKLGSKNLYNEIFNNKK